MPSGVHRTVTAAVSEFPPTSRRCNRLPRGARQPRRRHQSSRFATERANPGREVEPMSDATLRRERASCAIGTIQGVAYADLKEHQEHTEHTAKSGCTVPAPKPYTLVRQKKDVPESRS